MGAFISSPLPPALLRHEVQQGPFALRTLLRFIAPTNLAATVSPSVDFPVDAGYTTALASAHFPVPLGRGRFLQLLGLSLLSCRLYHPAGVMHLFDQFATHSNPNLQCSILVHFVRNRTSGVSLTYCSIGPSQW
jgi:hypothetical protein